MTKIGAKSARHTARLKVGLVCDEGTSLAGTPGMTDLFKFAGEMAQRRGVKKTPAVRITRWRAINDDEVQCVSDSMPGVLPSPGIIIIPGNFHAPAEDASSSPLIPWLRQKHSEGVVLAAVCGGVFFLARTGLLSGRQATTHWGFSAEFSDQFPDVLTGTDKMVIDYGDVLTAGGVLAWADLGPDNHRTLPWPIHHAGHGALCERRSAGREQRFYSDFDPRMKHGDAAILKAQRRLAAQRERTVSVAELAQDAGLEPRTFIAVLCKRQGIKPSEYQQRLWVSRAREMLEFSRKSIEDIATDIGYKDVAGFRRMFLKIVGLTPADYRRRFCRGRTN